MNEGPLRFPDASRPELRSVTRGVADRTEGITAEHRRLRGLLDASRAVVEELDLERVITRIVEAAMKLVDARYAALAVIEPGGRLERFVHVGMTAADVEAIGHLPEGHGLLGAVIESGETIRLEDLGDDPRSIGFPGHHPAMSSFLGVPIRVRDEVFGNLYLTDRKDGPFTSEDEELVTSLADMAGIAIENARLYEEARRRQRLSTALSEVTAALLSPGAGEVFTVVAARVSSIVSAALVTIVVPGPDDDQVRIDTASGVLGDAVEGIVLPAESSLAARVIARQTVVVSKEGEELALDDGTIRLGATVAAPLIVAGKTVGALCVSRNVGDDAFTRSELSTVSEFAAQAGLAAALAWARLDRERLDVIEDRSRIARDLHDHVIQRLFATGLGLQALASAVPTYAAALDVHIAEIDDAIADIRTAVFSLVNRGASDSTHTRHRLLDVVSELAPILATTPRITFSGPVDLILTGSLADDVVAVVREALANVARHAYAESTVIDVAVSEGDGDGDVTVTVDDDGVGPRAGRASGIVNLARRAEDRGGTFVLERREPRGTRARWHVPLAPNGAQ